MTIREHDLTMGKLTSLLVLLHNNEAGEVIKKQLKKEKYKYTVGNVESIDLNKIITAIEASAKINGIINSTSFRERNILNQTILEAIQGVSKGAIQIGDLFKKVNLTFSIVKGQNEQLERGSDWIGVCIYGQSISSENTIVEETLGLGFNHF